jgi:opacity protein-like surface antigen
MFKRLIRRALLIAGIVVAMDAYAVTPQNNSPYYLKVGGGVSMPTFRFNNEDYNESKASNSNFAHVGVGYIFNDTIRGDLVLTLREKGSVNSFQQDGVEYERIKQNFRSNTLMYNVYYDFSVIPYLTPYISAGVGISQNIIYDYSYTAYTTGMFTRKHSAEQKKYDLALSLGIGIKKSLTHSLDMDLSYAFMHLGSFKKFDIVETEPFGEIYKTKPANIRNHEVSLSIIYKL